MTPTPLSFWSAYRSGLAERQDSVSCRAPKAKRRAARVAGERGDVMVPEWTAHTCASACAACVAHGLDPWRELGRFDVVGVRWVRRPDARIWGVAYEHEAAPDQWRHELRKLWRVSADLKVLVGYHRDREAIRSRVQAEVTRLCRTQSAVEGQWLLVFGFAEPAQHPFRAWQVWTLDERCRVVAMADAEPFVPWRL